MPTKRKVGMCSGKKPLHLTTALLTPWMQPDSLQEYAVPRQLQSRRHPQAQECPSRTAILPLNGSSLQEPANHYVSHLLKHIHVLKLLHQPLLLHTAFLHTLLTLTIFTMLKPIALSSCPSIHIPSTFPFHSIVYSALKSVDPPTGLLLSTSSPTSARSIFRDDHPTPSRSSVSQDSASI